MGGGGKRGGMTEERGMETSKDRNGKDRKKQNCP